MDFGTPKLHFFRVEAWFYANDTFKYDKVFVFCSPKKKDLLIWLLQVPIFEGTKNVCPFYRSEQTSSSGVLLVMQFETLKLHFIRIEAWFYANGKLKYDNLFVFYSPKEPLF